METNMLSVCRKCGAELPESALYCPMCGKPVNYKPTPRKRGNGQGTVIKRGKTYTAIVNAATFTDGDRLVRKRVSKGGFRTRREALEYIPVLKSQSEGTGNVDCGMTLMELYEKWKSQHENDVSKSTMNCYKAAWKYYDGIKLYKVRNIKTSTLQECLDKCGKGRRTQENMKAIGTMLFRMAMSNDVVNKNYAEALIPRGDKQDPRQPFSDAELQKMWDAVQDQKYDFRSNHIDLVLILCYTGFRLEELLGLRMEDYHEKEDWSYFVGGLKTNAGRNRIVGISPKILPLVKRHFKVGFIFSENGKKISAKKFRDEYYYPALFAVGIEKKVPHCCRHTFATLMKDIDGSDRDKMAMIGHASISQTMEYTHANLDGLKKITQSL